MNSYKIKTTKMQYILNVCPQQQYLWYFIIYRLQQYDQVMQIIEDLITQSDCKAQVFCLLGDSSIILIGDTLKMAIPLIICIYEIKIRGSNYRVLRSIVQRVQFSLIHKYWGLFINNIHIFLYLAQTQQYQEAIEQYDILLSSDQQIDQNLKNMASMHKAQVLMMYIFNEIEQQLKNIFFRKYDYFQLKKYKQFIILSVDLNPKNSLAYYHLSQTLYLKHRFKMIQKMGITNEAQEALEKARLNGLEINDQTQPLLMNISGLSSDNNVPVHPYQ